MELSNFNIKNPDTNKKIMKGLKYISNLNEKVYIFVGVDNDTLPYFVSILLMIGSRPYQEIVDNYMSMYDEIFNIFANKNPKAFEAVKANHIDNFLQKITKNVWGCDLKSCDFKYYVDLYMRSCTLNDDEVRSIINGIIKH